MVLCKLYYKHREDWQIWTNIEGILFFSLHKLLSCDFITLMRDSWNRNTVRGNLCYRRTEWQLSIVEYQMQDTRFNMSSLSLQLNATFFCSFITVNISFDIHGSCHSGKWDWTLSFVKLVVSCSHALCIYCNPHYTWSIYMLRKMWIQIQKNSRLTKHFISRYIRNYCNITLLSCCYSFVLFASSFTMYVAASVDP